LNVCVVVFVLAGFPVLGIRADEPRVHDVNIRGDIIVDFRYVWQGGVAMRRQLIIFSTKATGISLAPSIGGEYPLFKWEVQSEEAEKNG